jgi:hypothetical protein
MSLRKGNQHPTFSTVGDWFVSRGEIAASMFSEYGVRFYESQEYELKVFLARKEDGSFAAKTICISKPRQNGKSFAARFYAIWMAAIEGKRVLFSAHHGKTVRKMFKEIRNFIENTPDFYEMLRPKNGIYAAAGTEGIYFADYYDDDGVFHPGGLIEFQTRTNSSARGETYQVIIVDEAQELTAEQLEAIKPTTIAADDASKVDSDPQMIYLGTPPNDKCVGTEFRRWHDEAHEDIQSSIWWMEWSVEELPETTDRAELMELVYETNPAMGYRIKESTMIDVMDTMSAEGFARECLGWWSKTYSVVKTVIRAEDWNACKVDNPKAEGLLSYGVKFSADGMIGTLAACYRPKDDSPFVYVVASRDMADGLTWFVDNLIERKDKAACVIIDGKSNAENLKNKLIAAGFSKKAVHCLGTQEAITANSMLVNAVKEHELRHYGQKQLDDSATKCAKRDIGKGGGFGFDSVENAEASLIESCAAALFGAMTTKRKPGRKAKVRC